MRTSNKIIMNAVSIASSVHSTGYWINQIYGLSIQAVFTGSPVGTVFLEGSNDIGGTNMPGQIPNQDAVVNWNTIKDSPTAVTGAGIVDWNYNGVFYEWIRLSYTASSGTGTITVTVNTKGV